MQKQNALKKKKKVDCRCLGKNLMLNTTEPPENPQIRDASRVKPSGHTTVPVELCTLEVP